MLYQLSEASNPMDVVIDDVQEALMGFVKSSPEAWAPIISAVSAAIFRLRVLIEVYRIVEKCETSLNIFDTLKKRAEN